MDMDMDQDMGGFENQQMSEGREGGGLSVGYSFGNSGSGGFGFGPGAEEDEEDLVVESDYKNGELFAPFTSV
jgi:hypothetical protein